MTAGTLTGPTREQKLAVVAHCPAYLYSYAPEPGDRRYVFKGRTVRSLEAAYRLAQDLDAEEAAK